MDKKSPISSPMDTGALARPCSVSLKINATSVMLYQNVYLKGTGDQPGMSAQKYLCAFSINETEIPVEFQEKLQQATAGQPQRYQELVQAIHERALVPARQRREANQLLEQRSRIKNWVSFARLQLEETTAYEHRHLHLPEPEIQKELRMVLEETKRLLVKPKPNPVEHSQSEQRLQQLLAIINGACCEIQEMMPMSAQKFGRGYDFSPETVREVRQLWFRASDTIAVLNQRQQLKRPNNWSEMRDEVMALGSQGEALTSLESSPS